jgi:hypothetical protein
MHYIEMSEYCHRLPFALTEVKCVGWISPSHDYLTGQASSHFVEKLTHVILNKSDEFNVHVNVMRGILQCDFCHRQVTLSSAGMRPRMLGMSELWIPSSAGWFAAPSLIIHYTVDHGYLPPVEFGEAVLSLDFSNHYVGQEVFDRLVGL